MPRPTTKADLLTAANDQFAALWALIDSMPELMQRGTFAFEDRDRNLRDVLTHLHEWHNMMKRWYRIGTVENGAPEIPGKGYTWRTLPALNAEIKTRYQQTSLDEAKTMLKASHEEMLALIASHTNDELFAKNVYKWTKTSTLGAYFVSNTSSHYDWAIKKLKKHKKSFVG